MMDEWCRSVLCEIIIRLHFLIAHLIDVFLFKPFSYELNHEQQHKHTCLETCLFSHTQIHNFEHRKFVFFKGGSCFSDSFGANN